MLTQAVKKQSVFENTFYQPGGQTADDRVLRPLHVTSVPRTEHHAKPCCWINNHLKRVLPHVDEVIHNIQEIEVGFTATQQQ